MKRLYPEAQLRQALRSENERVAIWAAYHFLLLRQDLSEGDLELLLSSKIKDIQEGGINKITNQKSTKLLPDVVRLFRESEGQIKYAAAYALSQFPNDINKRLLEKWFDQVMGSEHSTRLEIETAALAFLSVEEALGLEKVLAVLAQSTHNLVKGASLLGCLLPFVKTRDDLFAVIGHYFELRDHYSDAEVTQTLMRNFVGRELVDWLAQSMGSGYPLSQIFEQGSRLFQWDRVLEMDNTWLQLDKAAMVLEGMSLEGPKNLPLMLVLLRDWLLKLERATTQEQLPRQLWLVDAFLEYQEHFERATPKIRELESRLLLSLPLQSMQTKAFEQWMQEPSGHFSAIANYYHSTLLSTEHCELLLERFFPTLPPWSDEQLKISKSGSPLRSEASKAEALWLMFRGELWGYEISFPDVFPNPFLYQRVPEVLANYYQVNFEHFLQKQDSVVVDYALKLFQMHPSAAVQQLLLQFAKPLLDHHGEMFYQTLEFLPSLEMAELLLASHRVGETEQARLIQFMHEVFGKPVPTSIQQELSGAGTSAETGWSRPIRLHCDQCDQTFQYPVEVIYVDEGAIQRMSRITESSVWTAKEYFCKNCHHPLPFRLDHTTLEEISQQSRVDRILRASHPSPVNAFGYEIQLLNFPRFEGRSYNPKQFAQLLQESEGQVSQNVLNLMKVKMARLYRGMEEYALIPPLLEGMNPGPSIRAEMLFLMGYAYFKINDFPKARRCLEPIAIEENEWIPETPDSAYYEKAIYLLKAMNSYAAKRSHLQVIQGKK